MSSARELSVDVPSLFLSLVSVVPNTLNNRSQLAEFATIERSRSARRKKDVGAHPGNSNSSKTANGSRSFDFYYSGLTFNDYEVVKPYLVPRSKYVHRTYRF